VPFENENGAQAKKNAFSGLILPFQNNSSSKMERKLTVVGSAGWWWEHEMALDIPVFFEQKNTIVC
jgi:hypothetical protein